ncbi:Ku protein [Acidobacteria bacterium AB60]|nr:Ku protein [Acidobacteria bacterium AB60]
MARPYWSGQIQISLVSFGVKLFPATEAKSEIHFHQISRKTGERVRHQNVSDGEEPVEKGDIVKGYEYSKGEYVQIDPKEIANLRIPSRKTLDLQQFVNLSEIDPAMYEKPYFIAPEDDSQAEAFAVVRKALAETRKAGLGKIAMSGREHVLAITVPPDDSQPGMMGYALRYAEELRKPAEYFADVKTPKINDESLDLAKELIKRRSAKFDPDKSKDEYEAALRAMVEAKMKNLPMPAEQKRAPKAKVINLMDALRQSVGEDKKKSPARSAHKKGKSNVTEMPSHDRRRKSA